MAGSVVAPPIDEYRGTNIVKKDTESLPWEIADFLFGVESIQKIASGKGTWGDALNVGVTAATFFIPPAKLAMLSSKTLNAVIKASSKVVESETVSVVAKKAAAKTLDDALTMKRQGYVPSGNEPVERVGKSIPFVPEGKPLDKFGEELVEEVSPYTAKETAIRKYVSKKEKEEQYGSTVEVKRAPKKPLTKEEEAIVKQVDEEIPAEIPKAEGQGQVPVINRKTGELEFESPMSEKTALPSELSVSPRVDRSAWLQNQMDKLSRKKNSLPKEERAAVQDKIDKYDVEFKGLMKKMNEQERAASGKLREELDKLDKIKSSKTKVKTTKFNLTEAKKELERLRSEWSKTPTQDFEKRNQLKQQGKTLADRIKKMEGK